MITHYTLHITRTTSWIVVVHMHDAIISGLSSLHTSKHNTPVTTKICFHHTLMQCNMIMWCHQDLQHRIHITCTLHRTHSRYHTTSHFTTTQKIQHSTECNAMIRQWSHEVVMWCNDAMPSQFTPLTTLHHTSTSEHAAPHLGGLTTWLTACMHAGGPLIAAMDSNAASRV